MPDDYVADYVTEYVTLVSADDQDIGVCEKMKAHETGQRHRAFSVFILRDTPKGLALLLHKRNPEKYHSGGLWTNTCCGHPRPGEDVSSAAVRRLVEEMGIHVPLKKVGIFTYKASLDKGLVEYEIDHVFIGRDDGAPFEVNPAEVSAIKWMALHAVAQDLATSPHLYTAWFPPALSFVMKDGV